jgi:hypothetical protein
MSIVFSQEAHFSIPGKAGMSNPFPGTSRQHRDKHKWFKNTFSQSEILFVFETVRIFSFANHQTAENFCASLKLHQEESSLSPSSPLSLLQHFASPQPPKNANAPNTRPICIVRVTKNCVFCLFYFKILKIIISYNIQ